MRITRVGLTTLTIKEKRKEGLKLLPDLRPVCCGKQLLTPNRPVDRPTDRPTQGTIKELLQTTLNRTVDLELFRNQLGQRVIEAADEFEERMKIRREKAVEPAVFRVIGAVCIKTRLSFLDSLWAMLTPLMISRRLPSSPPSLRYRHGEKEDGWPFSYILRPMNETWRIWAIAEIARRIGQRCDNDGDQRRRRWKQQGPDHRTAPGGMRRKRRRRQQGTVKVFNSLYMSATCSVLLEWTAIIRE